MRESKLTDEEARVAALIRYDVLDTPPEEPFEKITSLVQEVLQVPISAVSLIDRERQWFKSIRGLDTRGTPRSISFCGHTIQTDEPFVVADALLDPLFSANPLVLGEPRIRSYAGVPLRSPDGYNVGALCAIDVVPRDFSEAQLAILRSFASLVVDQLELRRIAERDHLTGALTRRGLVEQVQKEISRCRRHGRESALLFMDVDHFKRVNDSYGHPAGDSVLKAVASACLRSLRENDLFGRLGGEEFGILLTETDARGGLEAAEKIRKSIEALRVDVAGGVRVTASFGISNFAPSLSRAEDWIAKADEALYAAKRSGRNRCVVAEVRADAIAA